MDTYTASNTVTKFLAKLVIPVALLAPLTTHASGESVGACDDAQRYVALAERANEDYKATEAIGFYRQAADVCPRYETWKSLGDLAAAERSESQARVALDAYSEAYNLASSRADMAGVKASYAQVFFDHFDRGEAVDIAFQARNLDPDNPAIQDLARDLMRRSARLTNEDVKRGLGGFGFKPPPLRNSIDDTVPGAAATGTTGSGQSAIRTQINFLYNSTDVDEETAPNIALLASQLAGEQYSGLSFIFVGHADRRGTAQENQALSQRRAEALIEEIVALEPGLANRISGEGRGESQPRSYGSTEDDHRANRRLEVMEARLP